MTAASERAACEADQWIELAEWLESILSFGVKPATELSLTGFDPAADLARRTRRWSYALPDSSASAIATYAAGLARSESEAWSRDDPVVATQALSDRRFLLGDRFIHWVVPWLLPTALGSGGAASLADEIVGRLLELGDQHRPAPAMTGNEGLFPPGHDSIGPFPADVDPTSLLSGWVFVEGLSYHDARDEYRKAALLWREMAVSHPGTAQLWADLASRAARSAEPS